ncbi:MAG: hypothetical protein ACYSWO_08840 [Planctomycetota bacterium]|jgi:hypothetical protein
MKKVMLCLTTAAAAMILIGISIGVVKARCIDARLIDPAEFNDPNDNTYLPMAIGVTYVYWAETEDELILNKITNTSETVVILGVTCTVVRDTEWVSPDEGTTWFITEDTNDWYAWDNDGNVWYFGEFTTEFEYDDDWNLTGQNNEGSWTAGVDGALPGILMLADPAPGVCYQQEYFEDEAEDFGKVLRLNAKVSIDLDDYDDCLKTKEWTPLEPGEIEHKYYAPGVGLVFIEELKGKTVEVELISIGDIPIP